MHVIFVGPVAQNTGYGQACHDYLLALVRHGVSIEAWPIVPADPENLDKRYADLVPTFQGSDKIPTHLIVHTVPAAAKTVLDRVWGDVASRAKGKDVKTVLITTWETSRLPSSLYTEIAESFDLVVVPSDFCKQAMDWNSEEIVVVPHCFDSEHWQGERRQNDGVYRFYSILNWGERKNPIGLLKAYFSEFSAHDSVSLTIKLPSESNPRPDVEALYAGLGYPIDEAPHLRFEMNGFTHDQMVQFHYDHDCFVTAARGEGWNLPAFEAAIVGNAVIAPDWGGHVDFCREAACYFGTTYRLTPVVVPPQVAYSVGYGDARVTALAQNAPNGLDIRQSWCEPDLENLKSFMRMALNHQVRGRLGDLEKFAYEQVAPLLVETLKGIGR